MYRMIPWPKSKFKIFSNGLDMPIVKRIYVNIYIWNRRTLASIRSLILCSVCSSKRRLFEWFSHWNKSIIKLYTTSYPMKSITRFFLQWSSYPFVIMKILFQRLPCLSMNRFISNIWILFISWALVVFWAMRLPITETHPTEIMFTVVALHVIATAILLDTYMTLWTLQVK